MVADNIAEWRLAARERAHESDDKGCNGAGAAGNEGKEERERQAMSQLQL
jgi:hypothetical protein